jgi:hypothetical protein
MSDSDENHARTRKSSVEDHVWSSICRVLGGRMIDMSDDVVCGLHRV